MKLSEILTDSGEAAINTAGDVMVAYNTYAHGVFRGVRAFRAPGKVSSEVYSRNHNINNVPGDDWQPLLTEAEWRAKHPLALRKLGEGEGVKSERWYLSVAKDRDPELHYSGCLRALNGMRYEVHELPPLPPAESEPTCEDGQLPDGPNCPKCGGNRAPSGINGGTWVHTAAPASNSVGERLTEAPEVGTPVVRFSESAKVDFDDHKWAVVLWHNARTIDMDGCRYYRWLGPIPVEPKEEKSEPPKWLGAVFDKDIQEPVFVTLIPSRCLLAGVTRSGQAFTAVRVSACDLRPDIMPPSPELAKLFGEEVKQ